MTQASELEIPQNRTRGPEPRHPEGSGSIGKPARLWPDVLKKQERPETIEHDLGFYEKTYQDINSSGADKYQPG